MKVKQMPSQTNKISTNKLTTKKITTSGILLALALILGYLESLIPFYFGIPGAKLGLPNLLVLVLLYRYDVKDAAIFQILRVTLTGLLFGNMFGILYSLSGALCSFIVMVLVKKWDFFDITGVSVIGGVFHNIGQILLATVIISKFSFLYYIPVLLIAGMVAGMIIGKLVQIILQRGII